MTSAGMENIAPAAKASQSDVAVWTILFSRIVFFLNIFRTTIERTAAGIYGLCGSRIRLNRCLI
jgi:hypothetical protein